MRRPLIFAILAGLAAVLAAIIVFSALKRREAEVQKALASTVDIVVAARDLHLGRTNRRGRDQACAMAAR